MLPAKYEWITTIGQLPAIVSGALQYLGVKEYPTVQSNNPVIMEMARKLGVQNIYPNDETAWCAVFMCYICVITGQPMPYHSYEVLRAASFQTWGSKVEKADVCFGDICVFKRPDGNHVTICIAVSKNSSGKIVTLHVLGGNQSNSVSFTEIEYSRLIAVRRYYADGVPASVKQYVMNASGNVSGNEA
jgi:uncharacterized protein (TIGR02594 family)